MPTTITITGRPAIDYARATDIPVRKYADPTEVARDFVTVEEAELIAAEDPSLVYVEIALTPTRARVHAKVCDPRMGATRESPLPLMDGAEFKAAIWLYEHNLLGMSGRGFYPLPRSSNAA